MRKRFPNLIIANAILFLAVSADAQFGKPKSGLQPMKSAVDLIKKQASLQVNQATRTLLFRWGNSVPT